MEVYESKTECDFQGLCALSAAYYRAVKYSPLLYTLKYTQTSTDQLSILHDIQAPPTDTVCTDTSDNTSVPVEDTICKNSTTDDHCVTSVQSML